jgi:hypothetical protein
MAGNSGKRARCFAVALPLLVLPARALSPAPEPVQASVAPSRAETQKILICRPDPALLVPQSPPDCVFGRADLEPRDPSQWTRLKIEYERQCYMQAEGTVGERLRRLQVASRCEGADEYG